MTGAVARKWLPWVGLVIVVVAALAIGSRSTGPTTAAEKAASIASDVRCPTCEGQSAELSDAPAAAAVRQYILQHVEAGQSRGEIEQSLRDDYGSDILLRPSTSGVVGLVWVIPVVVVVIAMAALAFAFRRWKATVARPVSDVDRRRVADARREAGP